MPPKSKWRSDDAQHFTLVHRSQRDPLINDPEAPDRVLARTQRRKGPGGQPIARKDLEDEFQGRERGNIGEAANYGVYFDDTEYDYMQHLRPIGGDYNAKRGGKDEEDDVDVVMLPGPAASKPPKGKQKAPIQLRDEQTLDLPADVLASANELPRDWARGTEEAGGLRLDMDPHLRQALEALDDDAFLAGKRSAKIRQSGEGSSAAVSSSSSVPEPAIDQNSEDGGDDADDDDFDALFAEVVAGGEYDPDDVDSDDEQWRRQAPGGDEALFLTAGERAAQKLASAGPASEGQDGLTLSERVALFKEGLAPGAAGAADSPGSNDEAAAPTANGKTRRVASSIGGSSIFGEGGAGKKSKPGSKARHAMSFYAPSADGGSTAWSMSSSAMERNAGLQHVDEGFDRMEQIYEQDEDELDFPDDDEDDEEGGGFVREDFENILDEFLEKHEVIGGKMRQRLGAPDATPAQKLQILREEVGQARIDHWLQEKEESMDEVNKDLESRIRVVGLRKDEWDVETIQTTKTNVSNHPRLLSSVASRTSYRPSTLAGPGGSSLSGSSNAGGFESIPKVRVNKRTGVSEVVGWTKQRKSKNGLAASEDGLTAATLPDDLAALTLADNGEDEGAGSEAASVSDGGVLDEEEDDSGDETETEESSRRFAPRQQTVKRDRNETKEEKRARKESAKTIKQGRKVEKAQRKAEFATERKKQVKMEAGRVQGGAGLAAASGGRLG
ncbi:unnamed protein product [Parajaminaea phylloscopi]